MLRAPMDIWQAVKKDLINVSWVNWVRMRRPKTWRFIASRFGRTVYGIKLTFGAALFVTFAFLFLAIAEDVMNGDPIVHFDKGLVALSYNIRSDFLTIIMLAVTDLCAGKIVLAGMILAAIWIWLRGRTIAACGLLASVCLGEAVVWFIKWLVLRPRPGPDLAMVSTIGNSFPSGHTFVAFALYGYIFWVVSQSVQGTTRAAYGALFILGCTAIGFSRVYLGAHWPSDVIASFFLGAAWLSALFTAIPILERTGEQPRPSRGGRLSNTVLRVGLPLAWLAVYVWYYITDLRQLGLVAPW